MYPNPTSREGGVSVTAPTTGWHRRKYIPISVRFSVLWIVGRAPSGCGNESRVVACAWPELDRV